MRETVGGRKGESKKSTAAAEQAVVFHTFQASFSLLISIPFKFCMEHLFYCRNTFYIPSEWTTLNAAVPHC